MNSKTHMVVMEVVSHHFDWYKNNCLIYKSHEILSGQIWAYCLVWFDSEIDMDFTRHPEEWLCKNFMKIGCVWIAHLYFTNEAYAAEMRSKE